MPSQEEYLDNLLKDLGNMEEETQQSTLEEPKEDVAARIDMKPESEAGILADMEAMESGLQLQDDFADLDMRDMEELLEAVKESAMESATGDAKAAEVEEPKNEEPEMEEPEPEASEVEEAKPEEPEMEEPEPEASEVGEAKLEEPEIELPEAESPESVGIEDIADMTEEDIERLLEAGRNEEEEADSPRVEEAVQTEAAQAEVSEEDAVDMDELMRLLGSTEDKELQDIHTMLQKSDNNEAVDDDIISMLENADNEENLVPDFEAEESMEALGDNKEKRAAEKKRQRAEKKEAKRQAKAAAKEARAAKKAQKKADKAPVLETADPITLETDAVDMAGAEPQLGEADLEPDLLEVLTGADDIFTDAFSDGNEMSLVSHEELTDNAIEKLEKGNKEKKSVFAKLLDFLTEEDEDEENGEAEILLSEENETILKEMDKEKGKNKKKGKKSKKKGKEEDTEDTGEGEEDKGGKKGKKPRKEKKPKKEKAPKIKEMEAPGKKLSKKKVLLIALICLSMGLVIILAVNVGGDYSSKKAGRAAYREGDFQTCFQNLYGRNLNESEQVMFYKSESILRIRVWLREYELLAQEGSELRALDSLIQSVDDYPTLYEFSSQWNAASEVSQTYDEILRILADKYHLTEEQAKEIAATPDDVTYTKKVMAIVNGEEFGSWDKTKEPDNEAGAETENQILPDMLPEEEELSDIEFLDNHE